MEKTELDPDFELIDRGPPDFSLEETLEFPVIAHARGDHGWRFERPAKGDRVGLTLLSWVLFPTGKGRAVKNSETSDYIVERNGALVRADGQAVLTFEGLVQIPEEEAEPCGSVVSSVSVTTDWNGYRWTVEVRIPEGKPLLLPGWLERANVLAAVDSRGVSLNDHERGNVLQGSHLGAFPFRIQVERAVVEGMRALVNGWSSRLAAIQESSVLLNLNAPVDEQLVLGQEAE